jgi:hypothetical protein
MDTCLFTIRLSFRAEALLLESDSGTILAPGESGRSLPHCILFRRVSFSDVC